VISSHIDVELIGVLLCWDGDALAHDCGNDPLLLDGLTNFLG
jgi:hypothetical protein